MIFDFDFNYYTDLCKKMGLEPIDSLKIQWGMYLNNHKFKHITSYSSFFGVKICCPDNSLKFNNWYWGCWCMSRNEIKDRFKELFTRLKQQQINKKLEELEKDFK